MSFDTGTNHEVSLVTATSATSNPTGINCTTVPIPRACPCAGANQVRVILQFPHTTPVPVMSYKFPYPTGILTGTVNTRTTSTDSKLEFFGDINDDGNINYVVYSLNPMTPANSVSIGGTTYTLYNLYRSITQVAYPAAINQGTNNPASTLVQNVLYNTTNAAGPTGQPIFGYPQTFIVGINPNQVTVVGTIVVTLSVAVNPQSLESGVVEWYTLASQMRPLNLAAAITVNQEGGSNYTASAPLDLPMQNPVSYYQ